VEKVDHLLIYQIYHSLNCFILFLDNPHEMVRVLREASGV
jgi:hypothetical protein